MSAFGRALLVAAFLLSQQAALAHQVWHLGAQSTQAKALAEGSHGNPLCAQHEALGTVVGGLSSCLPLALSVETPPVHFAAAQIPSAGTAGPSPSSRGPPTLL